MPDLSIILVDDEVARGWEPFALTRPAGELLYGALTFRRRAELLFSAPCTGHLAAEHLLGFEEEGAPPVLEAVEARSAADRIFLLSRALPDWRTRERWSRPERS